MSKKGWRNHYREGMPFPERLVKDIRSFSGDLIRRLANRGKLPVLVTWPDYPSKKTTIYKIAKHLRMRLTNKPVENAACVLFFEDATDKSQINNNILNHYSMVLNAKCSDISKKRVDAVFNDVFGYNTFIDPVSFHGTAVQKSDENAKHDGRYITCPVETIEDGCVYQKVIDNRTEDGFALDYRVVVIGKEIAACYGKYKDWNVRFTNEVRFSRLIDPLSLFSSAEQGAILNFCEKMNADFCELDVLKDNQDGRYYIVDLNTTPFGPPAGLPPVDVAMAVSLLADAFRRNFME
ncbi:MAG: hypothetical protein RL226_611 [Bacteroidota bacterium]